MADMPTLEQREFAEDHGYVCGKRGFAESENPWPEEPKGRIRVLHFCWRRGYTEGSRERAAVLGKKSKAK